MPILPTDPNTGQSQGIGQSLGDLFSGTNRPALNNMVATSQARNGLVSAQTQEAMIKASQAQEQMTAWERIKADFIAKGASDSDATLARDGVVGAANHDAVNAEKMIQAGNSAVLSNPALLGSPQQTAAAQGNQGKLAPLENVPNNFAVAPGAPQPDIQQSPQGEAQTAETNALAGLNQHKNTTPSDFRNPAVFGSLTPEGQAALTKAIQEGRLDPTRVNARNAPILAQTELQAPGTNYNRLHADAALQSNPTFQQRANGLEIMPGILQHLTTLGKALDGGAGYSDLRTAGKIQQFMNGEFNDPSYAEYMPVRNDAILRLAYLMRGQGASDQAAHMEQEAFAPTLAPYALDAWLKGQMSVLKPMIEKNNRIVHAGEPGQGTAPLTPPPATAPAAAPAAPSGPPPLGSAVPGAGGYGGTPVPPGATPNLPAYPDEASARAAGHKSGEHVIIGGQSGTLN